MSNEVAEDEVGEQFWHGPQAYPWCDTHNRLMLACELEASRNKPHPTPDQLQPAGEREVADECQRRADAVVDAAIAWHKSGQENHTEGWFEAGERLTAGIEHLLNLRAAPSSKCLGGCGIDFAEFPEMQHREEECPGPECSCYEVIGGHQPGCYFYGRKNATPAPVPVEQRCVECGHAGKVINGICQFFYDNNIRRNWCMCKCVFTPPANSEELMHEDELPPDMPKEDYDKWYAQSRVIDSIGCRIGPRYPFAAPSLESEVSEDDAAVYADYERDPRTGEVFTVTRRVSSPASTGTEDPRDQGTKCQSCGKRYKVDLNLPDQLWYRINAQNGVACNLLCPLCIAMRLENLGQFDYFDLVKLDQRATPPPSPDAVKATRQAFEDIAHLARERVNVPAGEVYALLERIDRRVSVALAELSVRSEQSNDKGDRD